MTLRSYEAFFIRKRKGVFFFYFSVRIFLRQLAVTFCENDFPQAIGRHILRERISLGNWPSHFAREIFLKQLAVTFCESHFPEAIGCHILREPFS